MLRLEQIDPNFKVDPTLPKGYAYYDPRQAPFQLYGLAPNEEGTYCRMPLEVLKEQSEGVQNLAYRLAGACVRFSTDSEGLCIQYELSVKELPGHFAISGYSGVELFEETEDGTRQIKQFIPRTEGNGASLHQSTFIPLKGGMRHYVLYLPLYNGLTQLLLGFREGACVTEGRTPRIQKPLVFYGSSITQGGCASKTGNCYTTVLARHLDAAQHNLGFSGSARGEESMARYIASLEMSAFILDYDHNAPNAEHLAKTHEPFFRIIREAQPELPIIIMTRHDVDNDWENCRVRREIIRKTYTNAVEAGDKNVYFVDGSQMIGNRDRDMCTVDGCHPTDLGFSRMAEFVEPILRRILYP